MVIAVVINKFHLEKTSWGVKTILSSNAKLPIAERYSAKRSKPGFGSVRLSRFYHLPVRQFVEFLNPISFNLFPTSYFSSFKLLCAPSRLLATP
jgi:hypothetical protein